MPLNVTIGNPEPVEKAPNLTVEFKVEETESLNFQLKLRSALNGDLMILDHKDIDIVVQPQNNKLVTFAKEILSDQDIAILFNPNDPKDLANKILNVLTNDCSKLVQRALSDVEPYSWDMRAKNITKFIEFSKDC